MMIIHGSLPILRDNGPLVIYTNAPVAHTAYWWDADGAPYPIAVGDYKSQIKKHRYDSDAILQFRSNGGTGLGTLTRSTTTVDGITFSTLEFSCSQLLVDGLEPGAYYCDILRTDTPGWIADLAVDIQQGITDPVTDIVPTLPGAVTMRQFRLALADQGKLHDAILGIPAEADDEANINWNSAYPVVLGDAVATSVQATLGYTNLQMIDLMLLAGTK
jgi:hypothetical protein